MKYLRVFPKESLDRARRRSDGAVKPDSIIRLAPGVALREDKRGWKREDGCSVRLGFPLRSLEMCQLLRYCHDFMRLEKGCLRGNDELFS